MGKPQNSNDDYRTSIEPMTWDGIIDEQPNRELLRRSEEQIKDFLEHLLPSLHCFGDHGELTWKLWRERLGRVPPRAIDVNPVKQLERCPTTTAQLLMLLLELGVKGESGSSDKSIRDAARMLDLNLRTNPKSNKKSKTVIAGGHGSSTGTPCSLDHLALSLLLTNDEWNHHVRDAVTIPKIDSLISVFAEPKNIQRGSPSPASAGDPEVKHPAWIHGQWIVDVFASSTDKQHARTARAFNPWGIIFPALARWLASTSLSLEERARVAIRIQAGLCIFAKGIVPCDWSTAPKDPPKSKQDKLPPKFEWKPTHAFSFDSKESTCSESRAEDSDKLPNYAVEISSARNAVYVAAALSGATRLHKLASEVLLGSSASPGLPDLSDAMTRSSVVISKAKQHAEVVCNLCVTNLISVEREGTQGETHAHYHALQFWLLARRLVTRPNSQWKSIVHSGLEERWRNPRTWSKWKNTDDVRRFDLTADGTKMQSESAPVASVETAATIAALAKLESDELCPTLRQGLCAWSAAWAVAQVVERLSRDDCFTVVTKDTAHRNSDLSDSPIDELPGYVVQRADQSTSVLKPAVAVAWDNFLWARMAVMALRLLRINRRQQVFATYVSRVEVSKGLAAGNKAPTDADQKTWSDSLESADDVTNLSDVLWLEFVKPALAAKHLSPVVPELKDGSISFILYGPPGSGKTYAVEQLAKAIGWPLITLSPADFIKEGVEKLEAQATTIFGDLMKLDQAVVFFDECDELFRSRHDGSGSMRNMLSFATASMLPKLQVLSKHRRVLFAVATNYLHHIDDAVRREGRFDARLFVDRPHAKARASSIAKKLSGVFKVEHGCSSPPNADQVKCIATAVATMARASHGCSHTQMLLLVDDVMALLTDSDGGLKTRALEELAEHCTSVVKKTGDSRVPADPQFDAIFAPFYAALKRPATDEARVVLDAMKRHVAWDGTLNDNLVAEALVALTTSGDLAVQSSFDEPPGAIIDYTDWILTRSDAEFAAAHLERERVESLRKRWQLLPGFAHAAMKISHRKSGGAHAHYHGGSL